MFGVKFSTPKGKPVRKVGEMSAENITAAKPTAVNPTLSRKIKKVLDTRTEQPELLSAIECLGSFYTENTISARRNLRSEIEKRGLGVNREFLDVFQAVHQELTTIENTVESLSSSCDAISSRLQGARSTAANLLDQTESLRRDMNHTTVRNSVVGALLKSFQLSSDEVAALESSDIGPQFFVVLDKVKRIDADCKATLLQQHHRLGLDIMDSMAMHQEYAYKRLFRWVQEECEELEEDASDLNPLLRQATQALAERPVLLNHCYEAVGKARRNILAQRFYEALTQGGPNGMPRPIELLAYDPLRYVGDMLAWIHQALAVEKELMGSIFGSGATADHTKEGKAASVEVVAVLDHVFEGVCRPFKLRVDQVLTAQPTGVVLSYKLATLLQFYLHTCQDMLDGKSTLIGTLTSCEEACMSLFNNHLKSRSDKFLHSPPPYPADLSPPHAVHETCAKLAEIMTTFDTSLLDPEAKPHEFEHIAGLTIEPLVQMCVVSAQGLDEGDTAVYLVNCLVVLESCLQPFKFAGQRLASVRDAIQRHLASLSDAQAVTMLQKCGLDKITALMDGHAADGAGAMAKADGLWPDDIKSALRIFYATLFNTGALVMPQLDRITEPKLRTSAREQVAATLASTYERVHRAVSDDNNGYQEQRAAILLHTPDAIRTVLDA